MVYGAIIAALMLIALAGLTLLRMAKSSSPNADLLVDVYTMIQKHPIVRLGKNGANYHVTPTS